MNALLKENQSAVWCGNISSFVHPSLPGQVRLWSQVHKQHHFIFQGEGKCFAFPRLAVRWKGWVHSGKRFGGWERRHAQLEASQGALEACPDLACAWHSGGSKSLRILEGKKRGGWETGEFYKKKDEGSEGRRGQASRKDHDISISVFLYSHSSESPTHTTFLFTKFCRAGDTEYASRHHGHMELSYGLMWVFSGRHILAMPQSTCAGINAVIESQGQSSALSKTIKLITRVGRH